nr:hypothetical protein CFP56_60191 [Quercus suber]
MEDFLRNSESRDVRCGLDVRLPAHERSHSVIAVKEAMHRVLRRPAYHTARGVREQTGRDRRRGMGGQTRSTARWEGVERDYWRNWALERCGRSLGPEIIVACRSSAGEQAASAIRSECLSEQRDAVDCCTGERAPRRRGWLAAGSLVRCEEQRQTEGHKSLERPGPAATTNSRGLSRLVRPLVALLALVGTIWRRCRSSEQIMVFCDGLLRSHDCALQSAADGSGLSRLSRGHREIYHDFLQ